MLREITLVLVTATGEKKGNVALDDILLWTLHVCTVAQNGQTTLLLLGLAYVFPNFMTTVTIRAGKTSKPYNYLFFSVSRMTHDCHMAVSLLSLYIKGISSMDSAYIKRGPVSLMVSLFSARTSVQTETIS